MAIKHVAVKASGDKGLASEWNDNHVIDGDVDFLQFQAVNLVFEGLAGAPAGPLIGQAYFDTALSQWRVWDGTTWLSYAGVDVSLYVRHDGSVAFTGNQSMGTHKLTNVVDPGAAQDAATMNYVDGKVSIIKGSTGYWSAPGCSFIAKVDDYMQEYAAGTYWSLAANQIAVCGVQGIPNGATITSAVVYGTFGAGWDLRRRNLAASTTSSMAAAAAGTADNTITNPIIDNSTYGYYIEAADVDMDEVVGGAVITYTNP